MTYTDLCQWRAKSDKCNGSSVFTLIHPWARVTTEIRQLVPKTQFCLHQSLSSNVQ
ncbi:hypothetical protein C8R42DRAFT_671573 [Lentinula raphanica]|nr:hypothetical protein C8R42DRAFT_671573 [Lentinula raphanica]